MKKIDSFEDWVISFERGVTTTPAGPDTIDEFILTNPMSVEHTDIPEKKQQFMLGHGGERYSTQVVCGRIIERYREHFYITPKGAIDLVKRVEAVVHGRPYVSEEEDQEFIQKMFSLGSWTPKEKRDLLEMKVSDFGKKDRVDEGEGGRYRCDPKREDNTLKKWLKEDK